MEREGACTDGATQEGKGKGGGNTKAKKGRAAKEDPRVAE